MGSPTKADRTAVAAMTEAGRLCTVTVQRHPLGRHELRYEGSESAVAALTPEVVELLRVALSLHGRSAIPAQCPGGGACTLVVIGHYNGRVSLYFHGSTATGAVLESAAKDRLLVALDSLHDDGVHESRAHPA